eukprot:c17976_g1_i1.p1 GENE.c17976_g1_i1~~c17976_g1_i1.p1  ORF type:complete len:842 (+),score=229.43 c17976_g1_i1:128-2527(+)
MDTAAMQKRFKSFTTSPPTEVVSSGPAAVRNRSDSGRRVSDMTSQSGFSLPRKRRPGSSVQFSASEALRERTAAADLSLTAKPVTPSTKPSNDADLRLSRYVLEMYQIGMALGTSTTQTLNEFGSEQHVTVTTLAPQPTHHSSSARSQVSAEMRKLETEHSKLNNQIVLETQRLQELEDQVTELQSELGRCETVVEAARERLMLCDQQVDSYQEEIAATDLSLLLIKEEENPGAFESNQLDQEFGDGVVTSLAGEFTSALDEPQDEEGGMEGYEPIDFGRDEDEDEGIDAERVTEYRASLVAELEQKTAERVEAEQEVQHAEAELANVQAQFEHTRGQLEAQMKRIHQSQQRAQVVASTLITTGLSADHEYPATSEPTTTTTTTTMTTSAVEVMSPRTKSKNIAEVTDRKNFVQSRLERLTALKMEINECVDLLASQSALDVVGVAGALQMGGDRAMTALIDEHTREKKALLARIADAEERAEAYAVKIVDEHRTRKLMVTLKKQRKELALHRAVGALVNADSRLLFKSISKWREIVRTAEIKKQEFELEQREQWITRSMIDKEREAMSQRRETRVAKIEAIFASRISSVTVLKATHFNRWRNKTHAFKAYVSRTRLNVMNANMLGRAVSQWKVASVAGAFKTWRARTAEAQIARENHARDCSRIIVKQFIRYENDRKRRALTTWQAFVLASRVEEGKRILSRYAEETELTVTQLSEAQRIAEEKARRYEIEQQRTRIQAEKLRSEFMQKRDHLMHQAMFHLQLTRCSKYFLKWKRYTHSCIMKDMEKLQKSMKMFGGE